MRCPATGEPSLVTSAGALVAGVATKYSPSYSVAGFRVVAEIGIVAVDISCSGYQWIIENLCSGKAFFYGYVSFAFQGKGISPLEDYVFQVGTNEQVVAEIKVGYCNGPRASVLGEVGR